MGARVFQMIRLSLQVLLFTTLFAACGRNYSDELPHGTSIGNIHFDHTIPEDQYKLLSMDLQLLDSIPIDPSVSTEMRRVMELQDNSPQSMRDWLEARIQYIVPENFEYYCYVDFKGKRYLEKTPVSNSSDLPVSMSNMGVFIYEFWNSLGLECHLRLSGHDAVPMRSPRAGVIQIGKALFSYFSKFQAKAQREIEYSILRLATLFHEARHSDGNQKSIGIAPNDLILSEKENSVGRSTFGFLHVLCPPGHYLKGLPACDYNLNGPYTVDALVMKAMVNSCKYCSRKSIEGLRILIADSFSRVLRNYSIKEWDPAPEGKR